MSRRLLVVADHPGRGPAGAALGPFLAWLRAAEGWRPQLLVWDASDLDRSLRQARPVQEVEAINRWRLPIWLGHRGRHRAMRRLRNLRVRWWWARSRRCKATYLYGPLRPEMRGYLPPSDMVRVGEPDAGPVLGRAGPAPSVTQAVASRAIDGLGPLTAHDALSASEQPGRARRRRRLGLPEAAAVLGGWSGDAGTPYAGISTFLRTVAEVRRLRPDDDVWGLWAGGSAGAAAVHEPRHEIDHLGVASCTVLVADAGLGPELARVVDVQVLVHVGAARAWPTDHFRELGVPFARFDAAEVPSPLLRPDAVAPFPDVPGLALAAAGLLDERAARRAGLVGRAAALGAP